MPTTAAAGDDETALLRAVGRLLHVDDDERIAPYREFARGDRSLAMAALVERDRRLLRMFLASTFTDTRTDDLGTALALLHSHPQVCAELLELFDELDGRVDHLQPVMGDVPLHLHARDTRLEIQAAFGDGLALRPPRWDSGVKWLPHEQTDVFAFHSGQDERRVLTHDALPGLCDQPRADPLGEPVGDLSRQPNRTALPPPRRARHDSGAVRSPAS